MKDNTKIIKRMVKVFIIGRMVEKFMVILMILHGMDMECFALKMEIDIKVNLKMVIIMVKE
jgi:hypothetical protein